MLRIGSRLRFRDNGGALAVRIYHMGLKSTFKKSSVTVNNVVKGSIIRNIPGRKLKRKEKVMVLILSVKKKKSRRNGTYFNFFFNNGLVIQDLKRRKPVASNSKLTVPKEVRHDKRNKLVYRIVTRCI